MTQDQQEFAPCPNCGSSDVSKVSYTWWGGALGPRILNHVKCDQCKTTYNGKTGQSNTNSIIIYNIVALVISCVIAGICLFLYFMLMNYQG